MTSTSQHGPEGLRYRTVWLSDIHLGFKDCKAEYLLDFLNKMECETLYLLGDIVDLWAMKKRFCWPISHYEVIRALFQKAQQGTRVVYIPGNHDDSMRDYIGESLGPVEIAEEMVHETADGRRLLLFHGDVLDGHIRLGRFDRIVGDAAYEFLLFLNRWANFFRRRFGLSYWSLAVYLKNRVKNARNAIDVYEKAAVHEAKRRGLDGVVCGHIHQAEIAMRDDVLYCNDGDWIESCTALAEDDSGHLELIHWTEKRQSVKQLKASNDEVISDVVQLMV